jgi:hypothetical protein
MLLTLAACGTPLPAGTASGYPGGHKKPVPVAPPPPPMPDDAFVCAADVSQCSDGSFVSRNPANGCEFDPCPGASKQ